MKMPNVCTQCTYDIEQTKSNSVWSLMLTNCESMEPHAELADEKSVGVVETK